MMRACGSTYTTASNVIKIINITHSHKCDDIYRCPSTAARIAQTTISSGISGLLHTSRRAHSCDSPHTHTHTHLLMNATPRRAYRPHNAPTATPKAPTLHSAPRWNIVSATDIRYVRASLVRARRACSPYNVPPQCTHTHWFWGCYKSQAPSVLGRITNAATATLAFRSL